MCLDKITKVYKPSLYNLWIPKFAYKSGVGWKIFEKDISIYPIPNLTNIFKGKSTPLPIGIWIHEKEYRYHGFLGGTHIYPHSKRQYPFGWHILEKEPDCVYLHVKRQVEYKYGHTAGIDATYKAPTIVAKYMKILD